MGIFDRLSQVARSVLPVLLSTKILLSPSMHAPKPSKIYIGQGTHINRLTGLCHPSQSNAKDITYSLTTGTLQTNLN